MKRKHLIGISVSAAVLGLLAFLAWTFLELHPRQRWVPPSQEARANEYLAFDRWLTAMGYPVRVLRSGNLSTILRAEEQQIFMQSSLFTWTYEAVAHLAQWIEEGGSLFLVLDHQADWELWGNPSLLTLLDEFGIEAKRDSLVWQRRNSDAPMFGLDFSFEVFQDEDALIVQDWLGNTRLVQVKRGLGRLIVSDRPVFMRTQFIDNAPNTRLAWALFAAAYNNERGWLFIRGTTRTPGLLGSLFRHGNLMTAVVSGLVLLIIGFWAVIPMFGLVRRDEERPGKPLRERFLAEGRFFKTYGALGFYRGVYVKEIKRRLVRKENISSDEEMGSRLLAILGKTGEEKEGRLLIAALRNEPIPYRDFAKTLSVFKTILERI